MTNNIVQFEKLGKAVIELTRKAGNYVGEMWKAPHMNITHKDGTEIVTEVDMKSQELMVEEIQRHFPTHGILAEENSVNINGTDDFRWIIDPLDGTTNFAHSYPCFCVSVGIEHSGEIVAGAVYDPTRNEMFSAVKGRGAMLNNRQIMVSQISSLSESLICTGFPYDILETRENNLKEFTNLILRCQGMRRDGSAALNLCYVACGRFDGFWELKLKPWDVAAGSIIISESGGMITDRDGEAFSSYKNSVLATNGHIQEEMIKVLSL